MCHDSDYGAILKHSCELWYRERSLVFTFCFTFSKTKNNPKIACLPQYQLELGKIIKQFIKDCFVARRIIKI